MADFARKLERELAAVTAERDAARADAAKLREALNKSTGYINLITATVEGGGYVVTVQEFHQEEMLEVLEKSRAILAATKSKP